MRNDILLKVSLAVIFVLILLGFVTIKFVLSDTSPMYTSSPTAVKVTNTSTDPMELSLDTIFINVHSSKFKVLKVDIAFKMKNSSDKKILANNTENVRNILLQYLAFMNANALDTEKGKEALKQDLMALMEENFSVKIDTVYFKNFILSP